MILHLIPQIMCKYTGVNIALNSVEIPKLGYSISGDNLMLRKPYPNKTYSVACKKKGNKGMLGILIDTKTNMSNFEVRIKWEVNGEVLTETRWYNILDNTFPMITDDHTMFYSIGDFPSCFVEGCDLPPLETEPCYMLYHPLQYRVKDIKIHTISKSRYLFHKNINDRYPEFSDMFEVSYE